MSDTTSYRGDPDIDAALDRETLEIGRILGAHTGERVLEVGLPLLVLRSGDVANPRHRIALSLRPSLRRTFR